GLLGVAFLAGLYVVGLRLSGVTELNAWQVYALFAAAVCGFAGISLFSLGAMFNYLVALFDKRPVRRGLFGKPIFDPPLDRHFGWMGIGAVVFGGAMSIVAAVIAVINDWDIARLWLYLMASALLVIIGVQLAIAWLVMRVLEQLAQREVAAQRDLTEEGVSAEQATRVQSLESETASSVV
ncbi:MAG: hypothetical protein N2559_11455, partial [Anaerolineae bacterium]|nr:hypothetical protein [Anaerolineae bacterium]